MATQTTALHQLIQHWKTEHAAIRQQMATEGAAADAPQYNILATEALCLSTCINDANQAVIGLMGERTTSPE